MWMDAQGVCEDGLWTPRLTMSARRCIKPPGARYQFDCYRICSSKETNGAAARDGGERKRREYVYMYSIGGQRQQQCSGTLLGFAFEIILV